MINELIGWQIVSMDKQGFVITKDGEKRTFKFDEDEGDCCGFNNFDAKLVYEEGSADNPVITAINFDEDESDYDENHVIITFFGGHKLLAKIDSLSSSGSGWCYGACVTCRCVETNEEETISCW